MPTQRTLNGRLSPSSRQCAHSPYHKVLKQQIGVPTRLRPIVAEVRDPIRFVVADATEWAVERACRVDVARCCSSVLRRRRAQATDAGDAWP